MVPGSSLMDVPRIVGRITDEGGGEVVEGNDGLVGERAEGRDVIGVERLGVFGEHDGSIRGNDGSGDAGARAPKEFFLFFGRAISVFLVGPAFDTEAAMGIALWLARFVGAVGDVVSLMVLSHPGGDVRDIDGNGFAQTRDLVLESAPGGVEQSLQHRGIEAT